MSSALKLIVGWYFIGLPQNNIVLHGLSNVQQVSQCCQKEKQMPSVLFSQSTRMNAQKKKSFIYHNTKMRMVSKSLMFSPLLVSLNHPQKGNIDENLTNLDFQSR